MGARDDRCSSHGNYLVGGERVRKHVQVCSDVQVCGEQSRDLHCMLRVCVCLCVIVLLVSEHL